MSGIAQWRIQGDKWGASVPRFGLHLTLRSTDDKINETGILAMELRKFLLLLTLECFRRKLVRKQIDWTGRTDSLSQKRSEWSWFCLKVGMASKLSCTLRAQDCTTNPPSRNPGSTTVLNHICLFLALSSWNVTYVAID